MTQVSNFSGVSSALISEIKRIKVVKIKTNFILTREMIGLK
jgi:hypothetical protein